MKHSGDSAGHSGHPVAVKNWAKKPPMSQISGIHQLNHNTSCSGTIPLYGVETTNAELLAEVRLGIWQRSVLVFGRGKSWYLAEVKFWYVAEVSFGIWQR